MENFKTFNLTKTKKQVTWYSIVYVYTLYTYSTIILFENPTAFDATQSLGSSTRAYKIFQITLLHFSGRGQAVQLEHNVYIGHDLGINSSYGEGIVSKDRYNQAQSSAAAKGKGTAYVDKYICMFVKLEEIFCEFRDGLCKLV